MFVVALTSGGTVARGGGRKQVQVHVTSISCEGSEGTNNHGHDFYVIGTANLVTDEGQSLVALILGGRLVDGNGNAVVRRSCRKLKALGKKRSVLAELIIDDTDDSLRLAKVTVNGRALSFDPYATGTAR